VALLVLFGVLSVSVSLADNKKGWVYRPGSPDRQLSGVMLSVSGDPEDMIEALSGDLHVSSTLFLDTTAAATSGTLFLRKEADDSVSLGPIEHGDLPDLDGTYLRLDTTNDPLTGQLNIATTGSTDASLLVESTGNPTNALWVLAQSGISNDYEAAFGGSLVSMSDTVGIGGGKINFEGFTDDAFRTIFTAEEPLANQQYSLPNISAGGFFTLAVRNASNTFSDPQTFTGNVSIEGDTTLGNSSSDIVTTNARESWPNATSTGNSLVIGGDADLYRSAASILRTPDSLTIDNNTVLGDASSDTITANARQSWPNATSSGNSLRVGDDVDIWDGGTDILSIGDSTHIRAAKLTVGLAANTIGNIVTDGFDTMNYTGSASGYPNNNNFQNTTGNTGSGTIAGSGSMVTLWGRGQASEGAGASPTNYETARLIMSNGVNSGDLTIDTTAAGTGTNRNIRLAPGGSAYSIVTDADSALVYTPSATQSITAASDTITAVTTYKLVSPTSSLTLTSTPTIAAGTDGQILIILNINNVRTITVQDEGTLAGSNIRLTTNTYAMARRDSLTLMYVSALASWIEIGRSNVL